MAQAEASPFVIESVRPVGMFCPAGISGPGVKCHLCLRRVTDTAGARQSGDVAIHNPCGKIFHDGCLSIYLRRTVPQGNVALDCPSCKAAWNVNDVTNINCLTGKAL